MVRIVVKITRKLIVELISIILSFQNMSKKLTFGGDAPFTGFLFCEGVPGFGNETSG